MSAPLDTDTGEGARTCLVCGFRLDRHTVPCVLAPTPGREPPVVTESQPCASCGGSRWTLIGPCTMCGPARVAEPRCVCGHPVALHLNGGECYAETRPLSGERCGCRQVVPVGPAVSAPRTGEGKRRRVAPDSPEGTAIMDAAYLRAYHDKHADARGSRELLAIADRIDARAVSTPAPPALAVSAPGADESCHCGPGWWDTVCAYCGGYTSEPAVPLPGAQSGEAQTGEAGEDTRCDHCGVVTADRTRIPTNDPATEGWWCVDAGPCNRRFRARNRERLARESAAREAAAGSVVLAVDPSRSTPAAALTPPVSAAALSDRGEDRTLRAAVTTAIEVLTALDPLHEVSCASLRPRRGHGSANGDCDCDAGQVPDVADAMRRALTPQGGAR